MTHIEVVAKGLVSFRGDLIEPSKGSVPISGQILAFLG